jgi:S1-C subfamily serine protease
MIFTLDGSIAGMIVVQENLPVMAPASALVSAADDLEHGRTIEVGDIGVQVTDLTDALAAAAGSPRGAVVAYVRPNGPADGALQVGDVITTVNRARIADAERLRIEIARMAPGSAVDLAVTRRGVASAVNLTVAAPPAAQPPQTPAGLGLSLRNTPDAGSEVLRVSDDGAAREAGVLPGDRITNLDGTRNPSAQEIQRAFAGAASGDYLIVGVTRGDAHVVLAIRKP